MFDFLDTNPNDNLTASAFKDSELLFRKLGTSLDSIVRTLNDATTYEKQPEGAGALHRAELQLEIRLINNILWVRVCSCVIFCPFIASQNLGAQPEFNSLLELELYIFTMVDRDNVTEVNDAKFWHLRDSVIRARGSNGLWFYPATVSVLVRRHLHALTIHLGRELQYSH